MRIIRLVTIVFLLCLTLNINAQVTQIGKVVELNSNGNAISGVGITILSSTDVQPAVSDNNGVFLLHFSEKEVGDVVYNIRISKSGYEVVNNQILREGWTLTENDTLRIILSPRGKLAEARAKYYEIIDQYQINNYKLTINDLQNQLKEQQISAEEFSRRANEAEEALSDAYQMIEDYADRFARINKDDLDSISLLAFNALDNGDVRGALKIYEEQDFLEQLDNKITLRNESIESINNLIPKLKEEINLRMLVGGEDNFKQINVIYEQIALADTTNFDNMFEYMNFLAEQN